jgi:Ca2+/H+ antiporter
LRNGEQKFDRRKRAMMRSCWFCLFNLMVPSLFGHNIKFRRQLQVEVISLGVAAVMIIIYIMA